ncbi:Mov34/MPN/PAD-1 family protein [Desulfurivibrio alkaliphilus]|uniref:Mov34/MPN/PAD-1 family protein n=1 Tax=Desulfurivibrio alkaliphilus (strain DSM 19089 / UNIQEM U267 / AHT2) TaxID=589865 RepID=D6Z0R5_DESAT|nr:M67 family metallopeptidase [Desulfurivibrio alkaliphilus]ADH85294.1 Mov34/MPN/PAD-1 family protein [Desulfurivibrio alkaliphilus AHT 2]
MLQIEEQIVTALLAHGRREEPNEACGYLAAKDGVICRHFELTNIDAAPDHYSMDPAEQFAAMRKMREEGLQLVAAYHSHPETPARPSLEDIRLANDPNMIYVIVSLMAGVEPVKAFKIEENDYRDIPLQILKKP